MKVTYMKHKHVPYIFWEENACYQSMIVELPLCDDQTSCSSDILNSLWILENGSFASDFVKISTN